MKRRLTDKQLKQLYDKFRETSASIKEFPEVLAGITAYYYKQSQLNKDNLMASHMTYLAMGLHAVITQVRLLEHINAEYRERHNELMEFLEIEIVPYDLDEDEEGAQA